MVPQRSPYSYPHFAGEETESESLLYLPVLPERVNSRARNPHRQSDAQALTLNHIPLYATEMFSCVYGQEQRP